MNDYIGVHTCDCQLHCGGIGDIELGTSQSGYLMTASLCCVNQFTSQLSASARDEDLHSATVFTAWP
jgi:hypothetical protein